ncbi:MAG TPA: SPOR domain-containing protein [Rhizomicrobium sp.]|nr:SPOR domain-containing protein [Rhizomicrobium sp.]
MANFERGVYEPSDEVKVYDGSEDEEDVEGSRLPLLIVLALLVLAMFGGLVWLAYTQGVARGRGETPVLAAAGGPERVAPQDPGGGKVPYQGFKIYEQPAPPDDSAEAAPPAGPAPQASAPKAAEPEAAEPKAAAAPVPATKAPPPAKTVAALIQQANSVPEPAKPVAKPPAPKPTATAPAMPAASATGAPRQLGAPAAVAAPATAKPATPAAAGSFMLQIGAYKSQADAASAWKTYQAKHAALLSGYSDNVQQVDLGEKGTWYRLRVGGFADREVATALCDRLKADGGACILGR